MKIEITEPGWAGYTGHFGTVEFKDGVSVRDVGTADAAQLAALVAVREVETGHNPSDAQRILDNASDLAPVQPVIEQAKPEAPLPVIEYTRESLEQIADKFGIKGVREIADAFLVRGTSITDLIDKVLTAQAEKAAAVAAAITAVETAATSKTGE